MTYDYQIDLITATSITNDAGDSIETETKRAVFAAILTYRNKSYYQALSSGLNPSITFAVNRYEYDDEKTIEHDEKRYRVIDVYPVDAKDETEYEAITLLCEAVI